MSFFLRSKPRLSSLIPNGFTDIHSHLLPGLDDGSKNIEETILMLGYLEKIGFSECITTTHTITGVWDNDRQSILDNWTNTKNQLPDSLRDMLSVAASEYMLDNSLLTLLEKEELLCLKNKHVLVEMSYLYPPLALDNILFEIKLNGYIPVLAHPERYLYFSKDMNIIEKIKSDGCLLQLNLLSVVGYYGEKVLQFADQLLSYRLIDYVGSDIHHMKHVEAFERKVNIQAIDDLQECIRKNEFFAS